MFTKGNTAIEVMASSGAVTVDGQNKAKATTTRTFGQEAREYSEQLARNGLVHVLASDAHNLRGRPPWLAAGRDALTALVGEGRARAMVEDAPRALLDGTEPQLPPVEGVVSRRSTFLSRWFGSD